MGRRSQTGGGQGRGKGHVNPSTAIHQTRSTRVPGKRQQDVAGNPTLSQQSGSPTQPATGQGQQVAGNPVQNIVVENCQPQVDDTTIDDATEDDATTSGPSTVSVRPRKLRRTEPMLDSLRRIKCYPSLKMDRLEESGAVSRSLLGIFRKSFFRNGRAWRFLTDDQKNYYWEEFKKEFWWDEADYSETIIKKVFMVHAASRYSDTISSMKSGKEKHTCVNQTFWDEWKAAWETPEEKKKSDIARSNRMSEVAGPGTGPVLHSAGSASGLAHKKHLEYFLGREPTMLEVYIQMHTKSDDRNVMVDKRSQNMKDAFSERLAAHSQPASGDGDSNTTDQLDHTKLYLDIEGVNNKKQLYGLGSATVAYVDTAGSKGVSRASSSRVQQNDEEVERLVQQNNQMEDTVAELKAQVAEHNKKMSEMAEQNKQMSEQMSEQNKQMAEQNKQMGELMTMLMSTHRRAP